ncbi:hypothetical protein PUV54_00070 [Hyphococcus flavus]|uniref:Uncharacterized protein n=1 Tax=Hyphococcus flavus TaxID=1866326 RepID=A0AAF0CFN0_9PROT|nr:hypothetical protein [Hyphococcus flavus]WDI31589.1 hypothetical protein PUV54_00070 [Hyphococcus flavus]
MTLETIVTSPTVRPVVVGWLDFSDEPVFGWTGNGALQPTGTGDPVLDGNVFLPVEAAVDISEFVTNMSNGRPVSLTYNATDNDQEVIRQIVRDRRVWQLRDAKIWMFFVDDNGDLHPTIIQMFSGKIIQANTNRQPGQGARIILELDRDLRRSISGEARWIDHGRYNAADKFSSFILDTANGKIGTADRPPTSAFSGAGFAGRGFDPALVNLQ